MTLSGCPIHWCSKLQTENALSTLEADYIALAQAMTELIPMRRKFDELCSYFNLQHKHTNKVKSTIFEDNNGCISCATAPKVSLRTCHTAVKYHFVQTFFSPDCNLKHPFKLEKIDTKIQLADISTKRLKEEAERDLGKVIQERKH